MFVQQKIHRKVDIAARIASGLISGGSMAPFILILCEVFAPIFPAQSPFYSALPVGALSANILWNIVALVLIHKFHRFVSIIGDCIITVLLIVLGAVGFAHDDNAFLNNGFYLSWDAAWLQQAIWGGALMIIVVVVQLFLIGWGFVKTARAPANDFNESSPPAYLEGDYEKDVKEKEKEFETDWQSVSSLEIPPNVEKM